MTMRSRPRTATARALVTLVALAIALSGVLVAIPPDPPAGAADGKGIGRSLQIQSAYQADHHENTWQRAYIDAAADGTVHIVMANEGCLSTDIDYSRSYGYTDQITKVCDYHATDQRFYFVPVDENPAPDSIDIEFNQFYIVSADTQQCFFSRMNGLVGKGNYLEENLLTPRGFIDCDRSEFMDAEQWENERWNNVEPAKHFTIINDVQEPGGGWPEWSNVLSLAYRYAAKHCAENNQSCRIRANGQDVWYPPGAPEVLQHGTVAAVAVGCGVLDAASSKVATANPYHNMTRDNVLVTIGTSQAKTHSDTVGSGWKVGGNVQFGYGMVAGAPWGFRAEASFEFNGTQTTVDSKTDSVQENQTDTIRPGDYFMLTWTEQRYTLDGHMQLLTDRWGGKHAWQVPISAAYPVATPGKRAYGATPYASTLEKSCIAGAAAVNEVPPAITIDPASCSGTPIPVPEPIEAGTALHVCPGTWKTAEGDKNPGQYNFGYQWYLTAGGTDTEHPITGATASSYTVSNRTLDTTTSFIGVKVVDLGHEMRLESKPVLSSNTPQLATRSATNDLGATDEVPEITNLVGRVPDGLAGEPYETSVVADAHPDGTPSAGDGMRLVLSESDLPEGFALSEEGILSGTAPGTGVYAFTVTDEGPSAVSQSYELTIRNQPAVFIDNADVIDAQIDSELSVSLVETPGTDSTIVLVEGSELPDGLELDPDGTLNGVPTAYGPMTFAVVDASSAFSDPITFTVDVEDSPITLHDQDEHHMVIGEQYEGELVADPGSGPRIGVLGVVEEQPEGAADDQGETGSNVVPLSDEHQEILQGLHIDPVSGKLHGTPVNEGAVTLVVGDLSHPQTPTKEVTIAVHQEAPASGTPSGWVIGLVVTGVVLAAAAGVAVYLVRRGRPGDGAAAA